MAGGSFSLYSPCMHAWTPEKNNKKGQNRKRESERELRAWLQQPYLSLPPPSSMEVPACNRHRPCHGHRHRHRHHCIPPRLPVWHARQICGFSLSAIDCNIVSYALLYFKGQLGFIYVIYSEGRTREELRGGGNHFRPINDRYRQFHSLSRLVWQDWGLFCTEIRSTPPTPYRGDSPICRLVVGLLGTGS